MAAAVQATPESRPDLSAGQSVAPATVVGQIIAPVVDPGVANPAVADQVAMDPWLRLEMLPCLLTIEIAVPDFTVADLVHLERGRVIATGWTVGQDVPLRINDELIAWSEFEIVQNRMAVRLTELA